METVAVYTGDSRNFHIFNIVDEESNIVGSIYVNRKIDIPEGLDINMITPNRDHFLWETKVRFLLEKSQPGSKNEKRLKKVLSEYKSNEEASSK